MDPVFEIWPTTSKWSEPSRNLTEELVFGTPHLPADIDVIMNQLLSHIYEHQQVTIHDINVLKKKSQWKYLNFFW